MEVGLYFSTNALDPSTRQDAWRQAIDGRCGPFVTAFRSSHFEGSIDARTVGGFNCARIMQTAGEAARGAREVARGNKDAYLVILQLAGGSVLVQADRGACMTPGDVTIIDSSKPSIFRFQTKSVHLSLQVPRHLLDEIGERWDERLATILPNPSAAIVGSLLRASFEQMCRFDPLEERAVRDSIMSLLAAGWAPGKDPARPRADAASTPSDLLRVIQSYIIARLHEETLTPPAIARAHNISERQLHRIFGAAGSTTCRWIRQARLDRCAADLVDPAKRARTITELAFATGFNDAAHFSRLFRAEFGQTPSEYRASGLANGLASLH